jgi:type I restriction enzyme S subunit
MIETKFKQTEIGLIPEDWNTKTIGEISYFYNGTAHESIVDENGRWILVNSKFISTESEVVKHVSKCLHPCYINDILMVMSDVPNGKAIAKCFIVNEDNKYSLNQRICRFSIFNGNPRFIYYALNRNPYYLSFDDGVKQTNLSKKEVINCPLSFPPLEEQSRIASALTSVDNLLSSLDKLIAKKRDIKQGAMQQLLTGKTRINGFTEPWGKYYVKDLGIFMKGHGISKAQAQSGDIPAVRYGELYTVHNNYIKTFQSCISQEVANEAVILQKGDILFACSGETKEEIGKCAAYIDDFKAYAGGDIIILRTDNAKYSALFLGFILNAPSVARQKAGKGQGDAIVHISKDALASITIHLPSLREQQAIAIALKSIDNDIAALEAKRKKYEAVKQGMMQQLLTGKIRLL